VRSSWGLNGGGRTRTSKGRASLNENTLEIINDWCCGRKRAIRHFATPEDRRACQGGGAEWNRTKKKCFEGRGDSKEEL